MSDTPLNTSALDFIIFTDNCFKEEFKTEAGKSSSTNEIILGGGGFELISGTETTKVTLFLSKVTFDKQFYRPGEFTAVFTILGPTSTNNDLANLKEKAKTTFLGKTISLVGSCNNNPAASQKDDVIKICQEYYIHNISFRLGGDWETLTLQAYSPDKKLTLNKYCNVYTGKKFGQEIFKTELTTGLFMGKGINATCDVKNLVNLKQTPSEGDPFELAQPYLVQYNETFYDFLCRVANRCGEPLYHEQGKLILGCPGETATLSQSPIMDLSLSKEDLGISVCDFYQDYTTNASGGATGQIYYNDGLTSDENFRKISTDADDFKFSDIAGLWILFSALAEGLTAGDFTQLITKTVNETGADLGNILFLQDIINEKYTELYEGKGDFTSLADNLSNLLNSFYADIQRKEQKATRDKIQMDFSSQLQKLYLGNNFSSKDTTKYLVTRLWGLLDASDEANDRTHYYGEAVPVEDGKFIPPVGPVDAILRSENLEAIVVKTDDPLRMGRVRVRYPWQPATAKDISPWIRTSVPFAGGLGGMIMTPEAGDHVMLGFIDSNIERPFVDGALYRSDQKPPLGSVMLKDSSFLPAAKRRVIASASGHSITFLDGSGASAFVKGLIPPIGSIWNCAKTVLKNQGKDAPDTESKEYFGGIVIRDSNNIYNVSLSTQKRDISISSPFGTVNINAFSGITINAPNGDVKIKGKNISLEAGNNISLKAGKNIKPKDVSASETIGSVLGGIVGNIAAQIANTQLMNKFGVDPSKFADLSFLRTLWEVLLRPVEGTLALQSNRNLIMTAGKGVVTIPTSEMSDRSVLKGGSWKKISDIEEGKADRDKAQLTRMLLQAIKEVIIGHFATAANARTDVYLKLKAAYLALPKTDMHISKLADHSQKNDIKKCAEESSEQSLLDLAWDDKNLSGLKAADDALEEIKQAWSGFMEKYNKLFTAVSAFKTAYSNINGLVTEVNRHPDVTKSIANDKLNIAAPGNIVSTFGNNYLGVDLTKKDERMLFFSRALSDADFTVSRKAMFRGTAIQVIDRVMATHPTLMKTGLKPGNLMQIADNDWATYVTGIDLPERAAISAGESFLQGAGKALATELLPTLTLGAVEYDDKDGVVLNKSWKKLVNYNGCAGPRAAWDVVSKGNILISNTSGNTYKLNNTSSGWEAIQNPGVDTIRDFLLYEGIK